MAKLSKKLQQISPSIKVQPIKPQTIVPKNNGMRAGSSCKTCGK